MPFDHFGRPVGQNDTVNVPCTVLTAHPQEGGCNLVVQTLYAPRDSYATPTVSLNSYQVEKVVPADAPVPPVAVAALPVNALVELPALPVIRDATQDEFGEGRFCQNCTWWARRPNTYVDGACLLGSKAPRYAAELAVCDGFEVCGDTEQSALDAYDRALDLPTAPAQFTDDSRGDVLTVPPPVE